jgi:hypothetical protein
LGCEHWGDFYRENKDVLYRYTLTTQTWLGRDPKKVAG